MYMYEIIFIPIYAANIRGMLLLRNSDIHGGEPQNTVISPASENNLNTSTSFGQIALTLPVAHLNLSPKGKYPLKATCPARPTP